MAEIHPSSTLRISDEKTMQLIELYQREECLWNTKIKYYRNKALRNEAVNRIAQELDIPNFDARHVVMKFKNLRNSYSQELKKIATSKATGDGSYTPSVFWYEKMNSFIRPHLQTARGGSYANSLVLLVDGTEEWVQLTNPDEQAEQSGSGNESTEKVNESQTKKRKAINGNIFRSKRVSSSKRSKVESDSDEQSSIKNSKTESPSTIKNSKIELSSERNQKSIISSSLKDLAANLHVALSRNDDYFDSFGKYIAGLLRSLPHRQALEVQPQIISLITAAELASHGRLEDQDDRNRNIQSVVVKVERRKSGTIDD